MTRGFVCSIASLACAAALSLSSAGAGPLDPPPGPPAPTYKTLDEIEPRIPVNELLVSQDGDAFFKITSGGAYYLTDDLDLFSLLPCVLITTSDPVTLDLNGFRLELGFTSDPVIEITSGVQGAVVIKNGHLIGGLSGIRCDAGYLEVRNVTIESPQLSGIDTKYALVVSDTHITGSADGTSSASGVGIQAGITDTLTGTSIERTSIGYMLRGIDAPALARINDVTVRDTQIEAIRTGVNSILQNLVVSNVGSSGSLNDAIEVGNGCSISACTVRNYSGLGSAVALADNCSATDIVVSAAPNGRGVSMGSNSSLIDSVIDNTGLDGVITGVRCVVKQNLIERGSGAVGFALVAGDGTVVDGNSFWGSIQYGSDCTIVRNVLSTGSYQATGASNTVGPINDLNSPWMNVDK